MKKNVKIVFAAVGGIAGIFAFKNLKNYMKDLEEKKEKFKSYYNVLNVWLQEKQRNKNLSNYFKNRQYKTIAIYGMGEIGKRLYDELKDSDIQVAYGIDQFGCYLDSGLLVHSVDEGLEPVDVVVVTPVFDFENIQEKLRQVTDADIISMEEVVLEN